MLPAFLQSLSSCLYSAGKDINCKFFTNNVVPSPNAVTLVESPISFNEPAPYSTKRQLWSLLMLTSVGINPWVNISLKGFVSVSVSVCPPLTTPPRGWQCHVPAVPRGRRAELEPGWTNCKGEAVRTLSVPRQARGSNSAQQLLELLVLLQSMGTQNSLGWKGPLKSIQAQPSQTGV